jgi:aromatic ring-opening dioxygenase LigB subunit
VVTVEFDLLDMAMLRLTLAPFQHHSLVSQEHGQTIPLAVVRDQAVVLCTHIAMATREQVPEFNNEP